MRNFLTFISTLALSYSALLATTGIFHTITSENFDKMIQTEDGIVIDCYAPWCGPCVRMGPIFDKAFHNFNNQCEFGKLEIGQNQEVAEKLNIHSIPTFVYFKNGQEVGRSVGQKSYNQLCDELNQYLHVNSAS